MDSKLKAVYTVIQGHELARPVFRRVGTAYVERDASLSIVLDALPLSGRLHVREADAALGEEHLARQEGD